MFVLVNPLAANRLEPSCGLKDSIRIVYLVLFQTLETSAKTTSGRWCRGYRSGKIKSAHMYVKIIVVNQSINQLML